ncbi:MAG: glycosyltransferase family 2 protein [Candidatus Micrarchaeota archaeon]
MLSIAILIPTFNEEEGIGELIDQVRRISGDKWTIYVVDSQSTDQTVEIAKLKGVKIINTIERGKGLAINTAFQKIDDEFVVVIDADLSYDPKDIPRILEKLNKYDVVLGSRFKGNIENNSMSVINKFGNFMLNVLANILYFKNVSDVCTGIWGFTKKTYKSMVIDAPHFELEANFFTQAIKKKFTICEVPISYKKRAGISKLGIIDGFKIALYLIKSKMGP